MKEVFIMKNSIVEIINYFVALLIKISLPVNSPVVFFEIACRIEDSIEKEYFDARFNVHFSVDFNNKIRVTILFYNKKEDISRLVADVSFDKKSDAKKSVVNLIEYFTTSNNFKILFANCNLKSMTF